MTGQPPSPDAGALPPVVRTAFRFGADGTRAACLAADEHRRWTAELWELGASGPRRVHAYGHPGDAAFSTVLPGRDGGLLMSRHGRDGQVLEILHPDGRTVRCPLGSGRPLQLVAAPAGGPWAGLAVRAEPDGTSTVLGIGADDARPLPLVGTPGRLSGGTVCGGQVLFTRVLDGRPSAVLVDPAARTAAELPLPGIASGTPVRPLACGGPSVLLAVEDTGGGDRAGSAPADGRSEPAVRQRIALAALDGSAPVRLLPAGSPLSGTAGSLYPLVLDSSGRNTALLSVRGARSVLLLHDWETDTVREVQAPEGTWVPSAAWPGEGLWLPLATSRHAAEPRWLPSGATRLRHAAATARPAAAHAARLETLPGGDGPIEAVTYGDWRTSPGVVLALHGGPNSRWKLTYEPFFQALADAGLAVVAPNQRGSTGYGARHTLAIVGDWGGPDLADVLAIAGHLRDARAPGLPEPCLYGVSYGAYLALLAAAHDTRWSGCAAVAPFLSGERLYQDGGPKVRGMVERLGGRAGAQDTGSPGRDLEALAPRLRLPLLLVHGAYDETVPVGHSRLLAARLRSATPDRTDVAYLEPADRGHHVLGFSAADPVMAQVVRFLRTAAGAGPAPAHGPAPMLSTSTAGPP